MIQSFEYTHELAWNVFLDFLEEQNLIASKDSSREAFKRGLIQNGADIDLTLIGNKGLNLEILHRIMDEIDDLLLPYTFDLSIFHPINDPDEIDHIHRVGVVFYEKDKQASGV